MRRLFGVWPTALVLAAACANPPADPAKQTTKPTYDKTTGKLTQLTYDRNANGVIDTWTDMDGAKPLRSRIDANEDGRVNVWETYAGGTLKTTTFDEDGDGRPDRRLTYRNGALALIESAPDASGNFTKRVEVK
jgi:hypothetical protein